ncbi:MAG TPA: GNAT family N-acetyltransferase [Aliidongia sp.]|nr:GNAT family N-acetyltransferase [Aliidongia sp.]
MDITSKVEIDRAVATLTLSFNTDPFARWLYDRADQYLLHASRIFGLFAEDSFGAKTAQRTEDGFGIALWLPAGIHGDDEPLGAVLAESMTEEKLAEAGAVFEQTEKYRPIEPHWYLQLIGVEARQQNRGYGAALLRHALHRCDRDHLPAYLWSSNPLNTSLYRRHGFETMGTIQEGSAPPIIPMLRPAR